MLQTNTKAYYTKSNSNFLYGLLINNGIIGTPWARCF